MRFLFRLDLSLHAGAGKKILEFGSLQPNRGLVASFSGVLELAGRQSRWIARVWHCGGGSKTVGIGPDNSVTVFILYILIRKRHQKRNNRILDIENEPIRTDIWRK